MAYWDEQTEATAAVYDAVQRVGCYLLRVNGNDAENPVLYPRPDAIRAEPETVPLSSLADFLS